MVSNIQNYLQSLYVYMYMKYKSFMFRYGSNPQDISLCLHKYSKNLKKSKTLMIPNTLDKGLSTGTVEITWNCQSNLTAFCIMTSNFKPNNYPTISQQHMVCLVCVPALCCQDITSPVCISIFQVSFTSLFSLTF